MIDYFLFFSAPIALFSFAFLSISHITEVSNEYDKYLLIALVLSLGIIVFCCLDLVSIGQTL